MAKDNKASGNTTDKNPAHQTGEEKGSVKHGENVIIGQDAPRGSEGDRRRASKGER